jgi:hypothetical protein
MLRIVMAYHFWVIVGVFITFALLVLLFLINSTLLIINIIKKNKGTLKRRMIPIVLPGIGIIISVLLSLPHLRLFYKAAQEQTKAQRGIIDFDKLKHKEGVDTIIRWDEDVFENGIRKYFIYENKKYIKFDTFGAQDVDYNISDIRDIEIDTLKGIILEEEQEKDTFLNSLFNVLLIGGPGERVLYKYIYTAKNCDDQSLLVVKRHDSYNEELFCDEEYFFDKYDYYNDIYNYNLIISKSDSDMYMFNGFYYIYLKENIFRPLSKINFDILTMNEEKYNNRENSILILNRLDPKGHKYEYITIYGISGDGVYKKLFKHYIIDNDDIYDAYIYNISDINAVKLHDDEKPFLLSLLE